MALGQDPQKNRQIFASIAHRYDLANDLMTLGIARYWRQLAVNWSEVQPGERVLDLATGTGDLALAFKQKVGPSGSVIGTDVSTEMLSFAPAKAARLNLEVHFEEADATQLPFEDSSFDICSIAYGIRNVSDPIKALAEMGRVLRPGGRMIILETGRQSSKVLAQLYQLYFRQVIPRIGALVTGNKDAYQYLNESSMQFPSGEEFLQLMKQAVPSGFSTIEYRSLMGGASYLYRGVRA